MKTKETKYQEAIKRQVRRKERTEIGQIHELNKRIGLDRGACKERERLLYYIESYSY